MNFFWTIFLFFALLSSSNGHATTHFNIAIGRADIPPLKKTSFYQLSIEKNMPSGLGFEVGTFFSQSTVDNNTSVMTGLPFALVHHDFHVKKIPIRFRIAGGFSFNHVTLFRTKHFISRHIKLGISHSFNPQTAIAAQYMFHFGKTEDTSFNGQSVAVGLKFNVSPKKNRPAIPISKPAKPRKIPESNYQQTQRLINELSWPTY
jgi:hypothetical protein